MNEISIFNLIFKLLNRGVLLEQEIARLMRTLLQNEGKTSSIIFKQRNEAVTV